MKKIFAIILTCLGLIINEAKAQITLDTTLNNSLGLGYGFKLVQISTAETKWYFVDTLSNTFSLYNMDFTPFITSVSVPEPFDPDGSRMQALYITRTLFDCDSSNIEYAYYSALGPNTLFRVVRTDGTILFQRDSVIAPYLYGATLGGTDVIRPIMNTSAGAKLFLAQIPSTTPMYVYSLCGTLPTDVFDLTQINGSFLRVFPNPTSHSLTFQVNLPDNLHNYELIILDNNGNELRREKINSLQEKYSFDVNELSSGAYLYSLSTKDKTYQTGKFILTK